MIFEWQKRKKLDYLSDSNACFLKEKPCQLSEWAPQHLTLVTSYKFSAGTVTHARFFPASRPSVQERALLRAPQAQDAISAQPGPPVPAPAAPQACLPCLGNSSSCTDLGHGSSPPSPAAHPLHCHQPGALPALLPPAVEPCGWGDSLAAPWPPAPESSAAPAAPGVPHSYSARTVPTLGHLLRWKILLSAASFRYGTEFLNHSYWKQEYAFAASRKGTQLVLSLHTWEINPSLLLIDTFVNLIIRLFWVLWIWLRGRTHARSPRSARLRRRPAKYCKTLARNQILITLCE